ncbi:serine/threonine-protein phosphatase 4 regulatory subunit 4-like isoform X2 [Saccostrea echinata]|uniref:serine/threonine-protein phosphatase 4 regulatory subunit 4-like isoform X2 n=1 Tax=Saccostrea echinata TaxID=191078 RepID=UPI002A8080DE|nr:serine/threonine-protein phosphatase 4 regulatory subunit 4-like isoform X2 [Saccostrea echinata]
MGSLDATSTSLAEDLQDLQLDRPTKGLKSVEELEKLTVDEHLSDIERAVYLLSSGQEVQRISVIHNLPDLLRDTESHDECMRRVVPKVREVLHVAQTEMQLAASSAFLQILQKNLVPIQNYSQTFLQTILNSVDSKDPDVASAWLDTLLDVIDLLPKEVIKKEILGSAIAKGQLAQSVQSRLACCRILGKISTKFEPFVIKKEILPVVQSLCQDVDYEVRGCMCRQLDCVARGLGLEATKSAILPELVELTNDEECHVRIAGLETVVNILSLLDSETCGTTIIPLVCKICQQAVQAEDATLPVVATQLGKLCHGISDNLTDEQKQWFIDYYKKLCHVGLEKNKASSRVTTPVSEKDRNKEADLPDIFELEDKLVECRKNSAFNFPAMVLFTGAKQFKSDLHVTFTHLCKDPHFIVRKTISSGFHEVCKLLGNSAQLIQSDLVALLKDDSIDVLKGVVSNMPAILDCYMTSGSNHTVTESKSGPLSDIIPAFLASENVIFTSNNWRLQQELMESMACLIRCYSSENLYNKVIPILKQKLCKARALPVKIAAARSLLTLTRKVKKREQREEIFHILIQDFCHARKCYLRSVFVDICSVVIELYSKKFFKETFFEYLLELHTDSVPNIRLRLCSILPDLKRLLILPTDRGLLQQLDACVRKLLVSEKDRDVADAIHSAVEELDKIHIPMQSMTRRNFFEQDFEDQKKEEEEKILLENEEREMKKEEEAAEKKKGDKRNLVSAKKGSENGSSSKIPAPRKGSRAGLSGSNSTTKNENKPVTPNTKGTGTSNNRLVKSKSINCISQIPRRDSKELSKTKIVSSAPTPGKTPGNKAQVNSNTSKLPSRDSNVNKKGVSSPKLSRLPLYNSNPNLHQGRPSSPSLIPIKASTTSTTNKTSKTTRGSGIPAPGSAGLRRASVPTISTNRRGSLGGQLSTEVTPKAKGSNGALTPSIKERKQSR